MKMLERLKLQEIKAEKKYAERRGKAEEKYAENALTVGFFPQSRNI